MRRIRGFTLVELMIVVAIIGVLAALAMYGVSRYLKRSKVAEASSNLGAIETGARQQYQRETPFGSSDDQFVHTFCPTSALTPATVPAASKVFVPSSSWNSTAWTCLKFAINAPQFYAYQHVSNGLLGTSAAFTASAVGDLDGNGTTSLFELTGRGGLMGDSVRESFRVVNGDE